MKDIRLNIGGPKGNAFYILGTVSSLIDDEELAKAIRDEMKESDYNHLLRTYLRYFSMVRLYSESELNGVDDDLYEVTDSDIIEL